MLINGKRIIQIAVEFSLRLSFQLSILVRHLPDCGNTAVPISPLRLIEVNILIAYIDLAALGENGLAVHRLVRLLEVHRCNHLIHIRLFDWRKINILF